MKTIKRSLLFSLAIVAVLLLLATSLTGLFTVQSVAHAAEGDEVLDLQIVSYLQYMTVGDEAQFVAEVAYINLDTGEEYTDTDADWSSSDDSIATVSASGLVTAVGAGTVTITASKGDFSADVTVEVFPIAAAGVYLSQSQLVLRVNGEAQTLVATVWPEEAEDKAVTWASDNDEVATVENGIVTPVGVGTATITVTTANGRYNDTCMVAVLPANEATLDVTQISAHIGTNPEINVTVEGATGDLTYEWISLYTNVASVDPNQDENCTLSAWNFGTTAIIAIVTDTEGVQYGASCIVNVTADYFYLVGLQNDWSTYDTQEAAEAAGVLLTQEAEGVYSIQRSFWANNGFQIIHSGINEEWTTLINPYAYTPYNSSDLYVDNTPTMFRMKSPGVYKVTLDLNYERPLVSIEMINVYTTEVQLSIAEGYSHILNAENTSTVIDVLPLPEGSIYLQDQVYYEVPDEYKDDFELTFNEIELKLTVAIKEGASISTSYALPVYVYFNNEFGSATGAIELLVEETAVEPVTSVAFDEPIYYINTNTGTNEPWEVQVHVTVTGGTIQDLTYSVSSNGISIASNDEGAMVTASLFGTYTIRATSVSNPDVYDDATVIVYSSQFYLAGSMSSWDALDDLTDTLEGSDFENWGLTRESYALYTGEFNFSENDEFAIVFLGMAGDWYGAIQSQYFDEANSSEYLSVNGTNVQVNHTGRYSITLQLDEDETNFIVRYVGEATVETTLNAYLMRAGGAWLGGQSDRANILAYLDNAYSSNNTEPVTIELTYNFADLISAGYWPTVQFVTASQITAIGGTFENSTWYNENITDVNISGDFKATYEEGETGFFTNGGAGCQLWWIGDLPEGAFNVTFALTIDTTGRITDIVISLSTAR